MPLFCSVLMVPLSPLCCCCCVYYDSLCGFLKRKKERKHGKELWYKYTHLLQRCNTEPKVELRGKTIHVKW